MQVFALGNFIERAEYMQNKGKLRIIEVVELSYDEMLLPKQVFNVIQ